DSRTGRGRVVAVERAARPTGCAGEQRKEETAEPEGAASRGFVHGRLELLGKRARRPGARQRCAAARTRAGSRLHTNADPSLTRTARCAPSALKAIRRGGTPEGSETCGASKSTSAALGGGPSNGTASAIPSGTSK